MLETLDKIMTEFRKTAEHGITDITQEAATFEDWCAHIDDTNNALRQTVLEIMTAADAEDDLPTVNYNVLLLAAASNCMERFWKTVVKGQLKGTPYFQLATNAMAAL